jgi:hypothetical protein
MIMNGESRMIIKGGSWEMKGESRMRIKGGSWTNFG